MRILFKIGTLCSLFLNMSQVLWLHYLYSLPLHSYGQLNVPHKLCQPLSSYSLKTFCKYPSLYPFPASISKYPPFFPFLYILSILQASPPIFIPSQNSQCLLNAVLAHRGSLPSDTLVVQIFIHSFNNIFFKCLLQFKLHQSQNCLPNLFTATRTMPIIVIYIFQMSINIHWMNKCWGNIGEQKK